MVAVMGTVEVGYRSTSSPRVVPTRLGKNLRFLRYIRTMSVRMFHNTTESLCYNSTCTVSYVICHFKLSYIPPSPHVVVVSSQVPVLVPPPDP